MPEHQREAATAKQPGRAEDPHIRELRILNPPYLQAPVRMTGHQCWCIEEFNEGALTPTNIDVLECSRRRRAVQRDATDLTHGFAYELCAGSIWQEVGQLRLILPE